MGEYERMVIDFAVIAAAPYLIAVVLLVLAAVAVRVLLRTPDAAIAAAPVLAMVVAWATTASGRVACTEARARAPSAGALFRA